MDVSAADLGRGLLVTGAAGVGKTTRLTTILEELLPSLQPGEHQVIPVVSAMHGARRRLAARIRDVQRRVIHSDNCFRFSVLTLDSLALDLANRCRQLLGQTEPFVPTARRYGGWKPKGAVPLSDICGLACRALEHRAARTMIVNSYPVVIMDEFQDCKGDRLRFVKALNECVPLVAAADEFQDIDGTPPFGEAVDWARSALTNRLDLGTESRRTRNRRILNGALAIRENRAGSMPTVKVYQHPSPYVSAKTIHTYLTKYWRGGTSVILAYKLDEPYMSGVLGWLGKPNRSPPIEVELVRGAEFGWRTYEENVNACGVKDLLDVGELPPGQALPPVRRAWRKCINDARRQGLRSVKKAHLLHTLERELHFQRSFGPPYPRRVAMSVHSAKNQEWDYVFVLWSNRHFRAKHTEEYRRRILYNGITRARREALVLAYDSPQGTAVQKDPFLALLDLADRPSSP